MALGGATPWHRAGSGFGSAMATAAAKNTMRTGANANQSATAGAFAPASASAPAPLDTKVRLVTPERIVFEYPLAGPFHRFCAYLIDVGVLLFLGVVATFLSLMLTLGSAGGQGLIAVACFVLAWGYRAGCEGLCNGQTLGKRILDIRVVSDRGVPITGAQAVLRNFVGAVDGLIPFVYLPGLASMLLSRKFQRLGDLAAGTMVVIEERRRPLKLERVAGAEIEQLLPWLPLRVSAGPELSRALSDYVRRRGRVGPVRREEIARKLAPAFRRRYRLPETASSDAVLCAVYHRIFLGE